MPLFEYSWNIELIIEKDQKAYIKYNKRGDVKKGSKELYDGFRYYNEDAMLKDTFERGKVEDLVNENRKESL